VPDKSGLRERKKLETRQLLTEIALRLFAERGFEQVTVADIAAAANVSQKTVFNYFETKEDLALKGREEVEMELIRAVRDRGREEPVLAVVRKHVLAIAERMRALPAEHRDAFRRVVATTPSVHARMRQMSLRSEDELALVLAAETGAPSNDVKPRIVASVIGVLARLAFGMTGSQDTKRRSHVEIVSSINGAFDLLEQGLANYGVRKRR
jgi:AcrR family transcriptional regulator